MGRSPCCSKEGLNRGAWTALEDKLLRDYIRVHGEGKWRNLPSRAGLKRCGKSCRLRWLNYLRPDIKRGNITHDEEELIIRLHKLLGNRWSLIAGRLPGRTDNEIKNYWNTNLAKKVGGQSPSTASTHHHKQASQKKALPIEAPPQSNVNSCVVVRAKASKCTKVFFDPHQYSGNNAEYSLGTMEFEESKEEALQLQSHDGIMAFSPSGGETSSDFGMDLDMGEICLTDFLNSDFQQLSEEARNMNDNNNNNFLSSLAHQLLFQEDQSNMDWVDRQCAA